MMTYENWKSIPGHPGYQASDLGRIRSVDRTIVRNGRPHKLKGKVLRPQPNGPYGYLAVHLGSSARDYVYRLVALTFISDPDGREVDHIDGNTSNNSLANLRFLPHAENMRAHRSRVTHCKNGHSYADAYWCPKGKRHCRSCRRESDHRRRAKAADDSG